MKALIQGELPVAAHISMVLLIVMLVNITDFRQ